MPYPLKEYCHDIPLLVTINRSFANMAILSLMHGNIHVSFVELYNPIFYLDWL